MRVKPEARSIPVFVWCVCDGVVGCMLGGVRVCAALRCKYKTKGRTETHILLLTHQQRHVGSGTRS